MIDNPKECPATWVNSVQGYLATTVCCVDPRFFKYVRRVAEHKVDELWYTCLFIVVGPHGLEDSSNLAKNKIYEALQR